MNRDLAKISDWCSLWGMKLNPSKTQSAIVSRFRTLYPNHPDLIINNVVLNTCESFKTLRVPFDSKLSLFLSIVCTLFLPLLPKRLDYLGNLIEFTVTFLSCESVSTPSFYLVWTIALLLGPLQLHLILSC